MLPRRTPAFVRIIHASPDIGIVDAFVDGQKILSNFEFGTVTDYVPLPAGSHKLQIALIGKGINASLVTQTMTVDEGDAYTVAALGTNASGFSFSVFKDNNLVAGNGAKVRVYHLSPFAGTVSIEAGSATIVQGLSYPQASNYVNVPAGVVYLQSDWCSTVYACTTLDGCEALDCDQYLRHWATEREYADSLCFHRDRWYAGHASNGQRSYILSLNFHPGCLQYS